MTTPTLAPLERQQSAVRTYSTAPAAISLARAKFPAVADIIAEVAKASGFTVPMLVGDRRSRGIVAARHYAYWRAARETGASLAAIGRAFGDRDHTTILHGIRMHEKRMRESEQQEVADARTLR